MCCELYYPSVGGVQMVIQQLAERFVAMGHDVTVATTRLTTRKDDSLNGVRIRDFSIYGNFVSGMRGEIHDYENFITSEKYDVIMVKAAQQWTFDALWPVLDQVAAAKVFIPCGFSGLYEPSYAEYFRKLPDILRKFDRLIFYASDYRDINFAKEHGILNYSIVPNGANELEFEKQRDPEFRRSLGIAEDDFIFLTVGSFTGLKGHLEVVQAFEIADMDGRAATLILNGNKTVQNYSDVLQMFSKFLGVARQYGIKYFTKHVIKVSLRSIGIRVGKDDQMEATIRRIKKHAGKNVVVTDLPRPSLVNAFMAADLFVFASNVEYSPLVLFESAAAGTPFLTVPVGNSEEIAQWTGAGIVCPAERDARGYTRVDPHVLAKHMCKLVKDEALRQRLGAAGKKNWREKFTWEKISREYEKIFLTLMEEKIRKA